MVMNELLDSACVRAREWECDDDQESVIPLLYLFSVGAFRGSRVQRYKTKADLPC